MKALTIKLISFALGVVFANQSLATNGITCRDYDPNRITLKLGSIAPGANFTLSGRLGYLEGGYLSEVIPADQPYELNSIPALCATSKSSPYIFECELIGEEVILTGLRDNKDYRLRLLGGDLISRFSLYEQTLNFAPAITIFKRLAEISFTVEGLHVTGIGKKFDFGSSNDDKIIGCRLVK